MSSNQPASQYETARVFPSRLKKPLAAAAAALAFLWCTGASSAALAQTPMADIEASYAKLKEAEAKKDPDAVLEWAQKTSEAARKVIAAPKPEKAEEAEQWQRESDYAKQVDVYTEYSQFATAVQGQPPAKVVALVESIEKRNPKSQYLSQVYPVYLVALNDSGQAARIVTVAENRLPNDPASEDLLLVLANSYMAQNNRAKATGYAEKLIEVLKAKAKPEGMADADWEKKKSAAMGRGQWIAGVNYAEAKRMREADQTLRAALPLIQGQPDLMGPALFYLGVANYEMAKAVKDKKLAAEAVRFSDQSAAVKGPYQLQAQKNARAIRTEFAIK